jgi:heme/copper-type cytochrome/quinol oxidase subunit 2
MAAVVDDLLQIAGLVALAFVIVGAVKFITSEGNSDNAANARTTIINSLAGLAVCIVATVLVNFIGTSIGK